MRPGLLLHGGAGAYRGDPERLDSLKRAIREAALAGFAVLRSSALDAVTEAVRYMEDSGLFNAGLGSALTLDGVAEMDAAVMDGSNLEIGAVACLRGVRNPVLVARKVMELTDHVLLAGEGAYRFAMKLGFRDESEAIVTEEKLKSHRELVEEWLRGEVYRGLEKLRELARRSPELAYGTVGAVALDYEGRLAAAVSTGGIHVKLRGRVGDSCLPGAGFYASSCGAAVATGIGEYIARALLCKHACDLMERGLPAREAARRSIEYITGLFGEGVAGLIAIDNEGGIGACFNTRAMLRAYVGEGLKGVRVAIFERDPPWMRG